MQILPDSIVRVRRSRWRVVDVHRFDDCRLVTLRGVSPPHAGAERRVLEPFDVVEPVERRTEPILVGRRRWRHGLRAALASDAPPGGLRAAAGAHIDLLPFQLEPALAVVRGDGCRLLIADEVGLGKTIQAGLIAAELLARGAVERVLILAPAGLRDQWQSELRRRLGLTALVVDAGGIRTTTAALPPDVNPWTTVPIAIASLDYVKRAEVLPAVAAAEWDLVIVDEAHGAASESDRRRAAHALCSRATYVVLLTATPHSGDREAFEALHRIGGIAGDTPLVFRRTRAEAGRAARRRVRILHVRPTRPERRMHALLRRYAEAVLTERADCWLAVSVLFKRALSGAAALAASIERRIAALDEDAHASAAQLALPLDAGEESDGDAPPAWPAGVRLDDTGRERTLLSELARAASAAAAGESKIRALERWLRRVPESVLVFTEYRDTLRHVQRAIGPRAVVLHGGMSRDERRQATTSFGATAGAVLLATDAAGEGLNLHGACRIVVNLELPWNPMRLEQRIGRVDRIGQRSPVHAVHLVARGTREDALLRRLTARIRRAQADIGAANPLGDGAERSAAAFVVLGRTHEPTAADAAPAVAARRVDWRNDAALESARLVQIRPFFDARYADVPARPWVLRARTKLRARLGSRRLEIWRVTAEDANGRLVDSHLVALLVDPRLVQSVDRDSEAVPAAASQTWRSAAGRVAQAFASARLERIRAVAQLERGDAREFQPGLFDRRNERERALAAAVRASRRAHTERRLMEAEASGRLAFLAPELLFVVTP